MEIKKTKKNKKNKKGQEEMVGFVIIIVLIIVIGIVFLGMSLRQKPQEVQHQESMMLDTMYSVLAYSTCGTNMRELIKDCYLEPLTKECNGEEVCAYVKDTFSDILDNTLGEDLAGSFIQGYMLNITIDSTGAQLIDLEKGITAGDYFGATIPIPVSGEDLLFNLRYYYSTKT
jgi:hypothetical protein